MTVSYLPPPAPESVGASKPPTPTQPLKVVRKLELEWDDPHPLDDRCLFVDHRATMRASTHVSATGASEFLAVRIDLPNGEHYLISLTQAAQANLATAIEDARTRWDA